MTNPFAANPMLLASAVMQGERIGQARAAQQQQIAERTRQNMIEGYKMQAMMAQEAARDGAEERQLARQMFADEMATRKMVFSEMMQNANLGLRLDERDYRRERDMTMDERYKENLGLRLDERDYRRERDITMDERYMENLRLSGERHKEQMGIRRTEAQARLERERRLGMPKPEGEMEFKDWFQSTTGVPSPDRSAIPQYMEAQNLFRHAQGIEQMDPRFGAYFTQDYRNRIQGNAANLAMKSAMGVPSNLPARDRSYSARTTNAIVSPGKFLSNLNAVMSQGGVDSAVHAPLFHNSIMVPIELAASGDKDSARGVAMKKAEYEAAIDIAEENKLIDPAAAASARESLKRIRVEPAASSDDGPSDELSDDPAFNLLTPQ